MSGGRGDGRSAASIVASIVYEAGVRFENEDSILSASIYGERKREKKKKKKFNRIYLDLFGTNVGSRIINKLSR